MAEKRALIVDDDPEIRAFVSALARRAGFQAMAIESLELFRIEYPRFQPDLIVLDLSLGDADGIEALEIIADMNYGAGIVVASGFEERLLNTALRVGRSYGLNMLGNLQKPLSPKALLDVFARLPIASVSIRGTDIEQAIRQSQLFLAYQPKVEVATGRVVGAEALVRWESPDRGVVAPDQFLPLAETSGLMDELTASVLEMAAAQAKQWQDMGLGLSVAVNLSASSLTDLAFPRRVVSMLDRIGLEPGRLVLEVTETSAMTAPERTMDILTRLRIRGISLALDDFGTGYSSLVELHRMPFSEIKIDKSFVMSAHHDQDARIIVQAILKLGQALNLDVVAEGVETRWQWDFLADQGCDLAQGYYLSRPLSVESFAGWLHDWPRAEPDTAGVRQHGMGIAATV